MKRTELKRKKRLNPKGKMTSKKFQGQALQAAYKQQFNFCELTPWFRANFPQWEINQTQLDLHHIRKPGRKDAWSNLIRVCRSIHAFDDSHPKEMAVVCLWWKMKKGGLDWNVKELDTCGLGTLAGYLERIQPDIAAFAGLWGELVRELNSGE